jgi:hypothetical protein
MCHSERSEESDVQNDRFFGRLFGLPQNDDATSLVILSEAKNLMVDF